MYAMRGIKLWGAALSTRKGREVSGVRSQGRQGIPAVREGELDMEQSNIGWVQRSHLTVGEQGLGLGSGMVKKGRRTD
jgi:hypothetical protein